MIVEQINEFLLIWKHYQDKRKYHRQKTYYSFIFCFLLVLQKAILCWAIQTRKQSLSICISDFQLVTYRKWYIVTFSNLVMFRFDTRCCEFLDGWWRCCYFELVAVSYFWFLLSFYAQARRCNRRTISIFWSLVLFIQTCDRHVSCFAIHMNIKARNDNETLKRQQT